MANVLTVWSLLGATSVIFTHVNQRTELASTGAAGGTALHAG